MRVIIQILICCTIFGQLHAQQKISGRHLSGKENSRWQFFEESDRVSASQLVKNKTLLKLGEKDELKAVSTKVDRVGMRHHRYQQMYNGVPVEWAVYLMHEKNALITQANGSLVYGLDISTTASISEETALQTALNHTNATLYAWEDEAHEQALKNTKRNPSATFCPSGELVIIDPQFTQQAANCRLAYKFDIYAIQPHSRQVVYVDAHSGEVLKAMEKIHSCTDTPATGETNYSDTVNFKVCYDDGQYTLINNIGDGMYIQVFDGEGNMSLSEIPFHDSDSHFDTDAAAVEVYWTIEKIYKYLLDTFGRNSIDDEGAPLLSWIHYGNQTNNAYWNGAWMLFGDGDDIKYSSLTSPDIVMHEIMHGLTDHTSNLIYQGESGALNEAFSDIFGEVIERYIRGSNDWIVGGDFTLAPKNGLRNLANPKDPNMTTRQPNTYLGEYYKRTGFADFGGVHTNSGVANYWFYLLSEGGMGTNDNGHTYDITGIGMEKATAIAYHSLTTLLPNANFEDARIASIQAAEGADEAAQVDAAWCAVGIGPGCVRESCRTRDSLALVALYDSTNGTNWNNTWDLAQPMDTWYGVTLNEEGCVTCIDMDGDLGCVGSYDSVVGNGLVGNIPPEIGNLTNLEYLYLSNNQLSGSIPLEIGNLTNLDELHLYFNELSGSIPPEIGNLTQLTWLHLHSNQLSGSIPTEIGNLINLEHLYLSDNELSGSIPAEIGNLLDLDELDLSLNELNGCFDINLVSLCSVYYMSLSGNNFIETWESFCDDYVGVCSTEPCINSLEDSLALVAFYSATNGNQWTNQWNLEEPMSTWYGVTSIGGCVIELDLSLNKLGGSIPIEIGNLTNLRTLHLPSNNLSGSIPPEIGNLINLNYGLDLSSNNLSGSIPPEIGNLINLKGLSLSSNQLSGGIPTEIKNLIDLKGLDLSSNNLSGNIPTEIGSLINLKALFLSSNNLDGNIPKEIGNLTNLYYGLDLSSNQLNGSIPSEIGNLTNLHYALDLSSNNLSGSIPPEIGNLTNLTGVFLLFRFYGLDLSSNNLSGSIPPEIGNLTSLDYVLDLSSNNLSGSIPSEIGNLTNLNYLDLSSNDLSGCFDQNLSNLCGNTIVSIDSGNSFDATWFNFCLNENGVCPPSPVLPGDFNNDGIVDKTDLIYWGLAKGYTGYTRPNATTVWIPQDSPEWDAFIDGVNCKHQDADGNGVIDEADLAVLESNYGNGTFSYNYNVSPAVYTLIQVSNDSIGVDSVRRVYDLYLQSNAPINTHGISVSVAFEDRPDIYSINIDTTGSSLKPTHYVQRYTVDGNNHTIEFSLTRTDKSNQLIDEPVAQLVVMDRDLEIVDPTYAKTNSGKMMSATGVVTSVAGSISQGSLEGVDPTLPVSLAINPAYCRAGGTAEVIVLDGSPPYTYMWSTGATSSRVNDLDIGAYSVTVSDATGLENEIDFEIDWAFTPVEVSANDEQLCFYFEGAPLTEAVEISLDDGLTYMPPITKNTCYALPEGEYSIWMRLASDSCATYLDSELVIDCIDVELYAWLEGAYNPTLGEMRTSLIDRKLLPGQTSAGDLATPTPAGQPYNIAPSNYTGTEGAGWTDADYTGDEIDWVLVSFRTGIEKNTEEGMAAGLLHKDGSIVFPNRCALASTIADSLYIVVEHRNHIGVMTPQPVSPINGTLTYDFRLTDSYRNPTSFGQKQLPTDEWAMYAGDISQMDSLSFDINGADKTMWFDSNGIFDDYLPTDTNLDGDVNGQDKSLWFGNNGITSRVPR